MVSIRRRKLLGLCAGRDSYLPPHSQITTQARTNSVVHIKEVIVHPLPSNSFSDPKDETISETGAGSSYVAASSPPKGHSVQPLPEIKRRKRHRRKLVENQEPCIMRGVYFKNMKWQAAIKVDKKQIHLGTVGSQEEAARLYDRAAFMCGREPNFELTEEEKQELRKFNWEEFLAMTRSAITNKKSERRVRPASNKRRQRNGYWEGEPGVNGFSASEDDGVAD